MRKVEYWMLKGDIYFALALLANDDFVRVFGLIMVAVSVIGAIWGDE